MSVIMGWNLLSEKHSAWDAFNGVFDAIRRMCESIGMGGWFSRWREELVWVSLLAVLLQSTVFCKGRDSSEESLHVPGGAEFVDSAMSSVSASRTIPVGSAVLLADRCPSGMVFIPIHRFCIHRWEAQLFYKNGKLHDPYRVPPFPETMDGMLAKASPGVVPQGYVGRDQAEVACTNAGFRLCTVKEWRSACRGTDGTLFPYGKNIRIEGRCNTHKFPDDEHLVLQFYPDAKWSTREMNDPRINQFKGGLAATGHYVGCTNAYGVFDMVGNLQEWVADIVEEGPRKGSATALGDHYMGQGKNYEGCDAVNRGHGYFPTEPRRNHRDYSTGFRCCADPQ